MFQCSDRIRELTASALRHPRRSVIAKNQKKRIVTTELRTSPGETKFHTALALVVNKKKTFFLDIAVEANPKKDVTRTKILKAMRSQKKNAADQKRETANAKNLKKTDQRSLDEIKAARKIKKGANAQNHVTTTGVVIMEKTGNATKIENEPDHQTKLREGKWPNFSSLQVLQFYIL
jgi:hypothetical protein